MAVGDRMVRFIYGIRKLEREVMRKRSSMSVSDSLGPNFHLTVQVDDRDYYTRT